MKLNLREFDGKLNLWEKGFIGNGLIPRALLLMCTNDCDNNS